MDKPHLDLAHHAHGDFDAFIGRVSLLLVEHNIDAITVTMFLRELIDAGGHASVWNSTGTLPPTTWTCPADIPNARRGTPPVRPSREAARMRRRSHRITWNC